jgi:hypothetical protein
VGNCRWLGRLIPKLTSYGFLCELRRRKVWRVAAGYGVVGWLVIQFATTVLPALTLPAWTPRLVIVLVLAGFPIALILAWAFDVGSSGIVRTPEPEVAEECPPAMPGRRRNLLTLAVIGLLISGVIGYFVLTRTSSRNWKNRSLSCPSPISVTTRRTRTSLTAFRTTF